MSSQPSTIHYQLSISSVEEHYFTIKMTIPTPGSNGQVLSLPTWIPGSYMVRDFAKNITCLSAFDENGQALSSKKLDKQTWKLEKCKGPLLVEYRVYAFDLSIRSAFLDSEFGFANGTSLFLEALGNRAQEYQLEIESLPKDLKWQLQTALPSQKVNKKGIGIYAPTDYRTLINNPLLFSDGDDIKFSNNNTKFHLVLAGGHQADTARIARDLNKITKHHLTLFGAPYPIDEYWFLTLLSENDFGGLEHTHSTALLFSRSGLPTKIQKNETPDEYRTFLSLCSHEFFHTWNVKRIKPKEYLAPDLSQEVYSEQLWVYEGFTSYYDDFSLLRAGLITRESYLELLGQAMTRLHRNAGRKVQSITDSSFDAWTKFYKQDENAPNAIVSYYNKGALLALCIDLQIRVQSKGKHSLDNVMQLLWKRFGQTGKGTQKDTVPKIIKNDLKINLDNFFEDALYSTKELPTDELLQSVGVKAHYRPRMGGKDLGGKSSNNTIKNQFGAALKTASGLAQVTQVQKGSVAQGAGLAKDDQIIALNQYRITVNSFQSELDKLTPNTSCELHIFRRGKLKVLAMEVKESPKDTIYLEVVDPSKAKLWLPS